MDDFFKNVICKQGIEGNSFNVIRHSYLKCMTNILHAELLECLSNHEQGKSVASSVSVPHCCINPSQQNKGKD